jgi:hypothetical protein
MAIIQSQKKALLIPPRRRALELGGGPVIAFSEIITVKPAWERAFESLTTLFDAPTSLEGAGYSAPPVKLMAWNCS